MDLFNLPPPLLISEWADKYRFLSSEASSRQGKWTCFPFQREPMDAALDPLVSSVTLEWAAQICGKTEIVNNVIGYHIDCNPCPILLIQPTVDLGNIWSKDRLATMVRDSPVLHGKVSGERSRDKNNTIAHKTFPGGRLSIAGANAPAGLSSRPIRIVICDEVDRYPESAGKEGDPVALAEKRTESFPDAIKFRTSTPTIDGMSRIDAYFKETDQRYFYVPLPCGHLQTLEWEKETGEKLIVWPSDRPEAARLLCKECGKDFSDEERIAAINDHSALWKATAPFKGHRGYHLNGLYCLFKAQKHYQNRLHQFADEFLLANAKGAETLKTWVNTFLAKTWKEKGRDKDHKTLMSRCENYPVMPAKALLWMCAVDTQEDRLELKKTAFGKDEESWGISYEVLMGNTEFDGVWDALFDSLRMKYMHPCGKELPLAVCFIDCKFRGSRVMRFVKRCQRRGLNVYACLGTKKPWDENLISRPTKSVKERATWFRVGTDHAKVTVFERLEVAEPGPRYMHFPIGRGFDEEYFKSLVAERLVLHYKNNILEKREWKKKRDRNEALDIEVYTLAAMEMLKPNWKALSEKLEVKAEVTNSKANAEHQQDEARSSDTQSAQIPPPQVRRPSPRRFKGHGFVGRW